MPQLELKSVCRRASVPTRSSTRLESRGGSRRDRCHLWRLRHRQDSPAAPHRRRRGANFWARSRSTGNDVADVAPEHRDVGMAFQNFALFPHMSAFENIASAVARRATLEPDAVNAGVDKVAKLLKIDHVLGHAPRELSNGQKQRTALARALAAEPTHPCCSTIPLRNVDAKLRFEMRLELPRLLRQARCDGSLCDAGLQGGHGARRPHRCASRRQICPGGNAGRNLLRRPPRLGVARLFGDPAINHRRHEDRSDRHDGPRRRLRGVKVPIDSAYRPLDGRDVHLRRAGRKRSRSMTRRAQV